VKFNFFVKNGFVYSLGVIIFSIFIVCCVNGKVKNVPAKEADPIPQMVFLVLSIQKDSSRATNTIEIINKNTVDGTFKRDRGEYPDFKEFLRFKIIDSVSGNDSIEIEHPLKKRIEFVNEKNQLEAKQLDLQKEEFLVRLPVKSSCSKIEIWEKLGDSPQKLLTTINR